MYFLLGMFSFLLGIQQEWNCWVKWEPWYTLERSAQLSQSSCKIWGFWFPNNFVIGFFILVSLVSIKWYLIVILICTALVTKDDEHLFMHLLAMCSSLEKCLFRSLATFKLGCLLLWVIRVLYVLYKSFKRYNCLQIFSFFRLYFLVFDSFLCRMKVFFFFRKHSFYSM